MPRALAAADQAVVLNNSGETHRRVMEVAHRRIVFLAEQLPDWLEQRMPEIGTALLRDVARPAVTKAAHTTPVRRALVSPLLDALRNSEASSPRQPNAASMAERVRAFEERGARVKGGLRQDAEPEQESPKPPKVRVSDNDVEG